MTRFEIHWDAIRCVGVSALQKSAKAYVSKGSGELQ